MQNRIPTVLISVACGLALIVVVLGAYTRLTQAGLGCPDWPGCYGHLVLPQTAAGLVKAQQAFPTLPIEQRKAWTEMLHRYAAGSLATLIVMIAIIAVIKRRHHRAYRFPLILPFVLVGLILFQAALGMWTVTLKLLPVVVMGHLLGGLTILTCLWWLYLTIRYRAPAQHQSNQRSQWLKPWAVLGVAIVFCQIALGGWVSANYAGLACVGFPQCNGSWFPHVAMSVAFNVFSPVGANYQGGVLGSVARVSIQVVHRYGAVITVGYLVLLSLIVWFKSQNRQLKFIACLILGLVLCQLTLGILNVIELLPLAIAVAHNAFAALTLLAVITLAFYSYNYPQSPFPMTGES